MVTMKHRFLTPSKTHILFPLKLMLTDRTRLASWFQFNDETVTKVSSLGDHLKGGGDAAEASKEKR
jgi:hypothetical protein